MAFENLQPVTVLKWLWKIPGDLNLNKKTNYLNRFWLLQFFFNKGITQMKVVLDSKHLRTLSKGLHWDDL